MEKQKVIQKAKFLQLEETEQKLWEAQKHSLLSLFPKYNGVYDDETINIVEDAAFIFVDFYPEDLLNPPVLTTPTTPTV